MLDNMQSAKEGLSAFRSRVLRHTTDLGTLTPVRAYTAMVFDWLVISCAIFLMYTFRHPLVYIVGAFVIAGRQHALFVMVHEGAHKLIHPNLRVNDGLSDFFCAFPLFVRTEAYRNHHGKHHQHLNSDQDPDWVRKIVNKDWHFPQTKSQFIKRNCMKYLLGFGLLEIALFMYALGGLGTKNRPLKLALRISYYTAFAGLFTYFHLWSSFLLYWFVPYAFMLPFLNRVRSVAEHFGLEYKNVFSHSRNIIPTIFDRAFFAPHQVSLHLDHHMFPAVAFYHLPTLHERLLDDAEYKEESHTNVGYVSWNAKSLLVDILQAKGEKKPLLQNQENTDEENNHIAA